MRRVRLWAPPVLLAGVIYALSSLSQVPGEAYVWDKLAHAAVFGLLAVLTLRATHGGVRPLRPGRAAAAALLVLAWGVLDELHQRSVPGRHSSVQDVLADAAGVAVALGLWTLWVNGKARTVRAGAGTGGRG